MTPKSKKLVDPYFLTIPELCALPEPEWVIAGLIPESSLVSLIGEKTAFKSFLALDWALHVAYGLDWYGHAVRQGPTAYVASEGAAGLQKRIVAWRQRYPQCDPNADVYRARTRSVLLSSVTEISPEVDPKQFRRILKQWKDEGLQLLVFDTLQRSMIGDENSVEAMGAVIAEAEEFQAVHHTAVLFLHHTGHGNKERGRGSSALPNAVDTEFMLKRPTKTGYHAILRTQKQKDSPEGPPLRLTLEEVSVPATNGGDPHESLVITNAAVLSERDTSKDEVRVLTYIKSHPHAVLREIERALKVPRSTVDRVLKRLKTEAVETPKSVGQRWDSGRRRK